MRINIITSVFFLEIILENLTSVYIGQIYRMVLAFYSYCGDKNLGAMMRNKKNVWAMINLKNNVFQLDHSWMCLASYDLHEDACHILFLKKRPSPGWFYFSFQSLCNLLIFLMHYLISL